VSDGAIAMAWSLVDIASDGVLKDRLSSRAASGGLAS